MRGDEANHHETLGFKRISCASQLPIPNGAGTNTHPVYNYTDMKSVQPNPDATRTSEF